jgi:hypothetical protein
MGKSIRTCKEIFMKQILVYISKYNKFDVENDVLIKVQIDNSLELGWRKKDIILVTNFPYSYCGISAIVISNENLCQFSRQASKINAILTLFKHHIIENRLYWFHDLDVFQMESMSEIDLNIDSIATTDYGGNDLWNTGIIFFRKETEDIFNLIKAIVYKYKTDEERALMALTGHDVKMTSAHSVGELIPAYKNEDFNKRIVKLNQTYNFIPRYLEESYRLAEKPIKCVHFHPIKTKKTQEVSQYDVMINGKNPLGIPLVNERLIKIFNKYINGTQKGLR